MSERMGGHSWESNPRRGEQLVQSTGQYKQDGQIDSLDVIAYLEEQRQLVQWHGYCGGGCTDLIEHYTTGRVVCPRTLRECPRERLKLLIELYSQV